MSSFRIACERAFGVLVFGSATFLVLGGTLMACFGGASLVA